MSDVARRRNDPNVDERSTDHDLHVGSVRKVDLNIVKAFFVLWFFFGFFVLSLNCEIIV